MKEFKNILVGVDFSDPSKQALKQAGRIANREGAKPTVLHVVTPSEIEDYQSYYTIPTDVMLKAFRTGIEDIVEEELGARDAAKCEVVTGVPYHELMRAVKDSDCDLLVLGSRGTNAGDHEVGFFAAKCVRHASVPVLLNRRLHGDPFNRVVAFVDYSEATNEVIETAAKIALDEDAKLHIVHAVCPPWMRPTHVLYNIETAENEDYKKEYRELLDEQMEAAAHAASQFLPVEIERHTLEHANPGQALLNFLNEKEVDLAVVGRIGSAGSAIKQFFIGSTAERLIHRSRCSVVTVPCNDK
ncbi:MAG: nucleotide-binding universal stress UspA family protein [Verrucomicrobiales bacterium]|jgi:nucleotide-binding universal stress UspA family protein